MSGFNEHFQLCLANGLTTRQALVASLPVVQMVGCRILADLVLTHYPTH
jgi:hypothetical protein